MIRTLIVDDIQLARENIRIRLQKHKEFRVVGEAASGSEAVTAISKLNPDLIFLDIQMPGLDGFDVLNEIHATPAPVVIFVTAHDEYAVKAFAAHAEHYLLKPIDDEQFEQALERARQSLRSRAVSETRGLQNPVETDHSYLDRIVVKVGHGGQNYRMLRTSSIDWVEAVGNYIRLQSRGKSYTIRMMLKEIEHQLNPAQFARISKSIIVNLDSVVEINRLCHGDFEVVLTDCASVRLSRRYRSRVAREFA
jgi:two-component system LytT family response regulator